MVGVLLATALPAASAGAESVDQARAEVAAAQARVDGLRPRVDRALAAYERALGDVAAGVSAGITAEQAADAAAEEASGARRLAGRRVRALYMTGGTAALVASILDAPSAGEALRRVTYVQRLVAASSAAADEGQADTAALSARAAELETAADASSVRGADVQRRYDELARTLAEAATEVTALSERARNLEEAAALLAQIAALNAAVDATGAARVSNARPSAIPEQFHALYVKAAKTCTGMSWTLLAAVGQVESGHGANPGTSYAGARGPMQFLPSTFAAYGVDGDRDGDIDIDDPADSVFSAARYLCANGAGRGDRGLRSAVWNYNHAQWYVDLVLKLAGMYAERDGD